MKYILIFLVGCAQVPKTQYIRMKKRKVYQIADSRKIKVLSEVKTCQKIQNKYFLPLINKGDSYFRSELKTRDHLNKISIKYITRKNYNKLYNLPIERNYTSKATKAFVKEFENKFSECDLFVEWNTFRALFEAFDIYPWDDRTRKHFLKFVKKYIKFQIRQTPHSPLNAQVLGYLLENYLKRLEVDTIEISSQTRDFAYTLSKIQSRYQRKKEKGKISEALALKKILKKEFKETQKYIIYLQWQIRRL